MFCRHAAQYFSDQPLDVCSASTGSEALKICAENWVDVMLLDQKLPDGRGVDLCPQFLSCNDQCKIIFITAYPSFDNAVAAIKVGAYDYLSKPIDLAELQLALDKALRTLSLEQTEQLQNYQAIKEGEETALIGKHGGLGGVQEFVTLSAAADTPVLITGETGAGKSIVAKSIHFAGRARYGPFISINCAALSDSLIESELFGHEKGAFTGAVGVKKGIFEMAEGGTLFLDEIGTLPLHLQSKLLGVLDDKTIRRVGGESPRPVDVRIIAACNIDIEQAVAEKNFRQDLYFRLSVLRITVPPLRERPHDIPELCRFFIRKIAKDQPVELPPEELEALKQYHWPGNVRELRNIVERSFILRKSNVLRPSELLWRQGQHPLPTLPSSGAKGGGPVSAHCERQLATLEEMERDLICRTLSAFNGNRTRAAKSLGISRATLIRKIKSYQLKASA
jgi:DNA-binding NtrC family response regulator